MILHAVTTGAGPDLVLLHGLFGSARNFGTVQRALAARFRVTALDLRNHGSSPRAADMDYGTMAGDVLETLEVATMLPAAILGHSMGGKAAMRVALERPEAVSALIVADIAPVAYAPHFRDYAAAMLAIQPGASRAEADAVLAGVVPDAVMRGFLLQNLRTDGDATWRIGLAEIAAALPDIEGWEVPAGRMYAGPALFISGETSDYLRPTYRPAIRVLFPAARFITLRHAGHWLHADNPSGFVSVVQEFLERVQRD